MRSFLLLIVALLSTSCVSMPKLPAAADGEKITVRYQPGGPVCFECESLEVVMTSDGQAIWIHGHGSWDTFQSDRYKLPFSPSHFAAWKARLEHFRPVGGLNIGASESSEAKNVRCKFDYHHMPSRVITWEGHGRSDWLSLDVGCDPEKYALLEAFFSHFPSQVGIKKPPKADQWVTSSPAR